MNSPNFKVVLAGDVNVGKTSLIHRFVNDSFAKDYLPTLGFQIFIKSVQVNDISVAFQIWDVGGGSSFQFLRKNNYLHSQGFLLVFDLGKAESFKNLERWLVEIRDVCPQAPFVLVANKADLPYQEISLAEINAKCDLLGASGKVFTSAKTGLNVKDAFVILGQAIIGILEKKNFVKSNSW